MNTNLRKTIIAGSIAAFIALPVWAASDANTNQSDSPAATAPGGTSSPMGQGDAGSTGAQAPAGSTGSGVTGSGNTGSGAAGSGAAGAGAAASSGSSDAGQNPLHSRTAGDLEGLDIVDAQGDKIGSIDSIVLTSDRSEAHAVVKVGGVLGMGGHTTLVSFDELTTAGENELRINATEDELKARPKFDDADYVEVESDAMVGNALN